MSIVEHFAAHPPPEDRFDATLAWIADRAAEGMPFRHGVKEFCSQFRYRAPASRQAAIADEPAPTGDVRHDAFLGALAEHMALNHDLRRPDWCIEPGRFMQDFWFVSDVPALRAVSLAQAPPAFKRRGILIPRRSLEVV